MKKNILFLMIIISIFISCLMPFTSPSAADGGPAFTKKIQKITVGKSVVFHIANIKKSYRTVFSSSNRRIAAVGKNTGKCTGKRAGKCVIYARIYNKNNRKTATLRQTLNVVRSSVLPNASFHLVQSSINPYDYTVKIGCSRILLKKEVRKSTITLIKKAGTSPLTAAFSNLSSNGREITYTLSSGSQRKLCPRDGTMDGIYILSSPLFEKKLSLSYQERTGNYSISGYVLSVDGSPINQAYIKCMDGNIEKVCHTDKNGFYRLSKVKNTASLTVTKSGFYSETLTDLTTAARSTRCENIILHKKNNNSFSALFHVTGQSGSAISNASVLLLRERNSLSEDNILFSGRTDKEGNILLYTDNIHLSEPCTKWSIDAHSNLSFDDHFPSCSTKYKLSTLSLEKSYTLLIGKIPEKNSPGRAFRSFTFCPKDYVFRQFYFDVKLSDSNSLSLHNISLKYDQKETPSVLHLSLYQAGCAQPVFSSDLNGDYFTLDDNIVRFTREIPCFVSDDTYYLKITVENEKNVSSFWPMTELSIVGGKCASKEISCLPPSFARILAYGEFTQTGVSASFFRCQKIGGQYFYLDTVNTSPFQGREWNTKTADLILPYTEPESSYLLIPEAGTVSGIDCIFFTAENKFIYPKEESAVNFPALSKIECTAETQNFPSEFKITDNSFSTTIISDFTATKSYVRSCPSYPNTVIVLHKKDGTVISVTLTASISININSVNRSVIMDIYTNGKMLC